MPATRVVAAAISVALAMPVFPATALSESAQSRFDAIVDAQWLLSPDPPIGLADRPFVGVSGRRIGSSEWRCWPESVRGGSLCAP